MTQAETSPRCPFLHYPIHCLGRSESREGKSRTRCCDRTESMMAFLNPVRACCAGIPVSSWIFPARSVFFVRMAACHASSRNGCSCFHDGQRPSRDPRPAHAATRCVAVLRKCRKREDDNNQCEEHSLLHGSSELPPEYLRSLHLASSI